jgi:hypothetical protein
MSFMLKSICSRAPSSPFAHCFTYPGNAFTPYPVQTGNKNNAVFGNFVKFLPYND